MNAARLTDVHVLAQPPTNGNKPHVVSPKFVERWFPSFLAKALPENWEHVTVNKAVESITMPKWIASAILIAFLAFMAQSWWARSSDHDAMVRIEQQLKDSKDQREKDDQRIENAQRDFRSWQGIMEGNYKTLIGMLTQQQVDTLKKTQKTSTN